MRYLLILLAVLFLAACAKEPSISLIDAQAFQDLDEDTFVIDVHTPEQEHIAGTDAFIPYDALAEYLHLLPEDKDTPIAVYCRSGTMSEQAAKTLQDLGYTEVYDLEGGVQSWESAGLPMQGRMFGQPASADKLTVFKSSSCGCCGIWSEYAGKEYETEVVEVLDMASVKEEIPPNLQSCHTTTVGGYFIEGHIPIEAIQKLLAERPDIKGIAMPGMPSGSPGMPGTKQGSWVIYAVHHNGSVDEFMRI